MAWFLPAVGAVAALLGRDVLVQSARELLPDASELLVDGVEAAEGADADGVDEEEEFEEFDDDEEDE